MAEQLGLAGPWRAVTDRPAQVGESPLWDAERRRLYFVDILGRELRCLDLALGVEACWPMESEPASLGLMRGGDLLLARRDGLYRFAPASGELHPLCPPPYDPASHRFNDGKVGPDGAFWVGTLSDARQPTAAIHRYHGGAEVDAVIHGISVSNGLAWGPDGRTLYWSDTTAHAIWRADFDAEGGRLGVASLWVQFPKKAASEAGGAGLSAYGGRPDGAAVDAEGAYWVAMYEGSRLLRLSPNGELLREVPVPVQCPTMPCFGGPDLKTLYLTSARAHRPEQELATQPLAGLVLAMEVDIPGVPLTIFG